jgi:hypothetical protein
MVVENEDVYIVSPTEQHQLKLQDTETNPYYKVWIKCVGNHPIYGTPLPYDRALLEVSNGIMCRKDISTYGGALMTAGDPNAYGGCGGGAIMMGHAFTDTSDQPVIVLTDAPESNGGFNTLWLKQGTGNPSDHMDQCPWAHLTLGCLNVNGYIDVGTSADGINRFILIQGPNASGQTATLKLIDDWNYIRATWGGPTEIQAYNDIQFKAGHGSYTATFWGSSGAWNFNPNCGIMGNGAFTTVSSITSGYLQAGGNHAVYATSGGTLTNSSSSIRYKQNIETLTDSSWLYNLRPVTFDWKDEQQARIEGHQIGFIAEEVYAVNPQMAWFSKDGQIEGVHYEKFCVPIIAELQKLKTEIDELKAKLATAQ